MNDKVNSGQSGEHVNAVRSAYSKSKHAILRPHLRWFVALLLMLCAVLQIVDVEAAGVNECLAREGKKPIINKEDTALYERKLFLTPDEVVRYVFLTNRRDDGDRSAAVYRAQPKKESLPGGYWVTATVAADSLANHPNVSVRRFDAPLPASVADVLHELWLAVCQQSRTDEEALPSAPTGIFSVVTARRARLKVVTVSLVDEHSLCLSLLNLSESLIDYPKLPAAKRAQAAAQIERESVRLLRRVSRKQR